MKKSLLVLSALLAVFMMSCQNGEKTDEQTEEQKTEKKAEAENDKEASACCEKTVETCDGTITTDKLLAKFNEDAEAMAGKEVSVCGKVTHVCVHSGKRMFLGTSGEEVVIVTSEEKFPEENMGKKVVVTGKVKLVEDAHQHGEDEEDHEPINDEQHKAAEKSHFEIETIKCQVCECDHSKAS